MRKRVKHQLQAKESINLLMILKQQNHLISQRNQSQVSGSHNSSIIHQLLKEESTNKKAKTNKIENLPKEPHHNNKDLLLESIKDLQIDKPMILLEAR